jgi:mannose-6-phosphate isomerase-like protein (cupin superfamily)
MAKSDSNERIQRPWGTFQVIKTGDGYQLKIITVDPGQELSLQLHKRRTEHWVVLAGKARAIIGDEVLELEPGDDAQVPVGVRHRLSNFGDAPLEIVESQFGDYLGEDDIVRFEDRYGRS